MDDNRLHPSEAQEVAETARMVHHLLNVNFTGHGPHALAHNLATDHRTLVQSCMRDLVIPFIEILAAQHDEGRWDARNKGSVELAAAFRDVIQARVGTDIYLPLV